MLTMKIKDAFFDRSAVLAQIGARRVKVLSKAGAFSAPRADEHAEMQGHLSARPASPTHEGSLRRLVLFGYDRSSDSVIVGPVGFNKSVAPARAPSFGGESTRSFFSKRQGRVMKKTVQIRPRPYMGPQLDREAARFLGLFKDALLKN